MGNRVVYLPAYEAEVEYLECTGTQWIDTEIVPDENCGVEVSIVTTINDQNKSVFGCETTSEYAFKRYHITPNLDKWWFGNNDIESSSGTYDTTIGTEYVIKYNINGEVVINNSKLADISVVNVTDIQPLCIAKRGPDSRDKTSYGIYKYKYFKIYSGSTLVRDFVPVRIGTTGYMYDKVSRQLFANAGTGRFVLGNDVANASVPQLRHVVYFGGQRCVGFEKLYERKEWLIIPYTQNDANALPIKSNNFNYRYIIYSVGNIAGLWTENTKYAYYPNSIKCGIWGQGERTVVHTNSNLIPLATPFDVECNSDGITMNGELMPNYGSSPYFDRLCIYCYTSTGKYALSKITVDDSIRYIPCTLSIDLPASMDANNIARTKGTSGMWDLVSDRFYGNVANSGTFKAVNLAEGVDYEVHDWLVADIPIGIAMMSLPINSSTFNCTIEHTGARANLPHLYSNGYIYYTESSNMDIISVWDANRANIPFSTSVGSLMTIESNEEYFKVNNISITKYGFPILRMVIQSAYNSNNASTTKTSKISVDGIERYIPVKLLRSIPSKYDANGIARQAGECGMYDTVNDLFYGNVASSGVFSVSDE